jgi:hypothetical protein
MQLEELRQQEDDDDEGVLMEEEPSLAFSKAQPTYQAPAGKPQPKRKGTGKGPGNKKPKTAAAPPPPPPPITFPAQAWLSPEDGDARVMRVKPTEKSSYLDGDWGQETFLTPQFLIQPGESFEVLKEENDFFQCKWKDFYGWLRTKTVSFIDPECESLICSLLLSLTSI